MGIKNTVKVWLCVSLGVFSASQALAQDPEFTQFYANPLYLNPAFAGSNRCPRVVFNYRNQWPGITGNYVTYSASYDQHVDNLSGGLGLMAVSDVAGIGTLKTNRVSGIYAYQLPVTRRFSFNFGIEGTYHNKSVDWSKLTFGDMIDPRRGFVYTTKQTPNNVPVNTVDFSAGVLGYSEKYFFGFAVHHLTEPDESVLGSNSSPLPRKFTGHAGAVIPLQGKDDVSISPNILFRLQQDFQQVNFGMYLNKGPMVGGLWYRNGDSFIVLLGVEQDNFKFGYSYDVTVSKLGTKTAGSHEISFALKFDCKPKPRRFRTISCPSF